MISPDHTLRTALNEHPVIWHFCYLSTLLYYSMITARDNYVFFAQNVLNEHMQTMVVYLQKLMKTPWIQFCGGNTRSQEILTVLCMGQM